MERNAHKTGLLNLMVLLVLAVVGFATARYSHVLSGQVGSLFLGLGVLVAAMSYFQMRLEERERLEKMELEELSKSRTEGSLFGQGETDTFPARRAREQFERFFVPGFTILLCLVEGLLAFYLWRWLGGTVFIPLTQPTVALGVLGLGGLILFLVGRYSAGLTRLQGERLLGPGANCLLLGAYLYFLAAVAIVVVWAGGISQVDRFAALALCLLLGLLAVESLVALVLEIYRPRIKGRAPRVLYESRLIGLLSHPEGLVTTAAHALDYQFGFKVSETWFYRFMEKALGWLLLAQLALLVLSTSFVFVWAGEEALLERFGRPVAGREVLQPGFHLKWPWPVDRVYRFRTQRIQSAHVGFKHEEETEREQTVLWTVKHTEDEFHLMVAGRELTDLTVTNRAQEKKAPPVSLLSASIPVHYRVRDLQAWTYRYRDADRLLEDVATGEVVRYMVSADVEQVMSTGRMQASEELRKRVQERADQLNLGLEVLLVGLADLHPPLAVAGAYEEVIGAGQKREANILDARAHEIRTNAMAAAEASRTKQQAVAERHRVEVSALAEAAYFTNQIAAFVASPSVYSQRAYLHTLGRGSGDTRKVIVAATNTQDVILLNLEEKVRSDLLGISLPATSGK